MSKKAKQEDQPPGKTAQAKAQDDQVMGTNNSSIVSKRSVEALYYPRETHFFRFFVAKFQKRAPLINRGYQLRLHVIDVLVRKFLRVGRSGLDQNERRKVVVNLGCGSDVLPWQCLTRYPADCAGVKFVDVDFPDLIARKRHTVENTPELKGVFTAVRDCTQLAHPVVYESHEYAQIGCDLRQLEMLRLGLALVLGGEEEIAKCDFLFVAEVSITYMETEGADGVIKWASGLGGHAGFVLLEQILPGGKTHPFSETMLSHFRKLNTPLKSVHTYPTLSSQVRRFESLGWTSVRAWTLWQAWADDFFFNPTERRWLDGVEPFDEWEEFALFGSHYCLVHATTQPGAARVAGDSGVEAYEASRDDVPTAFLAVRFDECPGQKGQRRFAAPMLLQEKNPSSQGNSLGIINTLGLGTRGRLQSCDVFREGHTNAGRDLAFGDGGPAARMCHSVTDLGDYGILLAGGRASPAGPFSDCWIFDKSAKVWSKTHELPVPLSRHSVAGLASGMALLAGGRTSTARAFGDFLLYHPEAGWVTCEVVGETRPTPVYGASLAFQPSSASSSGKPRGAFVGGLRDGLIVDQVLGWELDISDLKKPKISFTKITLSGGDGNKFSRHLIPRYGATCFYQNDNLVVLGGVIRDYLLHQRDSIIEYSPRDQTLRSFSHEYNGPPLRPLLVGHSATLLPDGRIVVVGGGATCFSMGTFWNKGVFTFRVGDGPISTNSWVHEKSVDIIPGQRTISVQGKTGTENGHSMARAEVGFIPRIRVESEEDFAKLLHKGQPVVISGLDLGPCSRSWTLDYLTERIGGHRNVVIHDSATQAMNFTTKNFRYVTTDFGDFAERVKKGDRIYLRALSEDKPAEKPALLAEDFPLLAADFVLPPQLSQVAENLFSSVLRVSGPVNMWLHYDVMANIYCQIGGTKRMILFPPSDVEHLSFAPGASSSGIDVFASLETPDLAQTHPQECTLVPGDVLFLPPLWLHTATPVSDESIAVNVFFRDLDANCYAAGRDVYGNRDLGAYEKGRQDIARIAKTFQKLPAEAREFYILRLADELRRKARV